MRRVPEHRFYPPHLDPCRPPQAPPDHHHRAAALHLNIIEKNMNQEEEEKSSADGRRLDTIKNYSGTDQPTSAPGISLRENSPMPTCLPACVIERGAAKLEYPVVMPYFRSLPVRCCATETTAVVVYVCSLLIVPHWSPCRRCRQPRCCRYCSRSWLAGGAISERVVFRIHASTSVHGAIHR